jgi:serine/threonine protein kinase
MVVSMTNRRVVGELTMAYYFEQCFKALVEIHDAGVLHLDIRPDNFMVSRSEETVKLIDFGQAVEIPRAPPVSEVRGGNVAFMAPERLSGGKLGKEADVWSLGVSLFGLVYGHYPYDCSDCRDAIVTGSPEPSFTFHEEVTAQFPSHVVASPQVNELLRSLLARDPGERCSAYAAMNFSWLCKARGLSRTEIDVLVDLEKPVVNLLVSLQCAAANKIFCKGRVAPADERDKAMDRAMDALQSQSMQSLPRLSSTKGSLPSL